MRKVSRFESDLLRILASLLGHRSVDETLPLMVRSVERPPCLSRDCVELVQDFLSKGVTEWLARSGWPHERFIRDDAIQSGRLWTRYAGGDLELHFSGDVLNWLIWLTADCFADPKSCASFSGNPNAAGDQLFYLITFEAIQNRFGLSVIAEQPQFCDHALLWLMFPDVAAELNLSPNLSFDPWFSSDRAWILEAVQARLKHRWSHMELGKRTRDPEQLIRLGRSQYSILNGFLDAAEQADRQDLARFILKTGAGIFDQLPPAGQWVAHPAAESLRMAERLEVRRESMAFLRCFTRLGIWQQEARAVGYYDEGYQASQLWKSEWDDAGGDRLLEGVQRLIRDSDPLAATAKDSTAPDTI